MAVNKFLVYDDDVRSSGVIRLSKNATAQQGNAGRAEEFWSRDNVNGIELLVSLDISLD
jgi:hypothetical protein